jgi:tungstate transport system permease protein
MFESFGAAIRLITGLNRELLGIIILSLEVSGISLSIAALTGLPLAALISLRSGRFQGVVVSLTNAMMGLPPVVVGLFLYLLLSRSGPLGCLGLLYTPGAMIIAQTILAFPIVVALCHASIMSVDPLIHQAARTLGATAIQAAIAVIKEARYGIIAGFVAALGRILGEVGAILLVGGNIAGFTRVMTTTIALETDRGNFEQALALGIILLAISLGLNIILHLIQKKDARRHPS